ncbi:MAG: hypothetical protein U1F43_02460 [Myxococcota bacterium]
MSDLGPAWLRHELPLPLATAWHFATLEAPVDGMAAAAAVEVALRVVTGLQLASCLADGGSLPAMLTDGRFKRPTLGSWIKLSQDLRDSLASRSCQPPELAAWPGRADQDGLLREIVEVRNDLAHSGQMAPARRRDAELRLASLASDLLATLGWLRRCRLVMILEAARESDDVFSGRLQSFTGMAQHPEPEHARWRGVAKSRHLYLELDGELLDVEPFLCRKRLRDARDEAVCVWAAFGDRGELRVRDDVAGVEAWQPIGAGAEPRRLLFRRLSRVPTSRDATAYGATPALANREEPPTLPDRPSPLLGGISPRPRRRKRALLAGLAVAVVGGAAAAAAVTLGGGAPAPVEARLGTSPPTEVPRTCAGVPPIAGSWTVETMVLGTNPANVARRGVRGDYLLLMTQAKDCVVRGSLEKRGYTEKGRYHPSPMSGSVEGRIAPHGGSLSFQAELLDAPGDTHVAGLSMRLAIHGDLLVGLWRQEGSDWQTMGYWGAILGHAQSVTKPSDPATGCYFDCVTACHGGLDPTDAASETCLLDCARRLDDCKR